MDLLELADAAMRARSHELEEQTDTSKVGVEGEEHNEDLGDAASEQQPQQDSRRRSTRQRTSVATRAPLLRTRRGQPMAVASTSELPGAPTQNRGGGDHEENVKGNTREGQEGEGSGVGVTSNAALVSTSSATELDAASALQAFTSDTPRSGASSTDNVDALPEGGNGKEPARVGRSAPIAPSSEKAAQRTPGVPPLIFDTASHHGDGDHSDTSSASHSTLEFGASTSSSNTSVYPSALHASHVAKTEAPEASTSYSHVQLHQPASTSTSPATDLHPTSFPSPSVDSDDHGNKSQSSISKKQKGRRPNSTGMDGKAHKCPHEGCAWSFSRREHLKRHEKTHTMERPFTCDVPHCGLKFSRLDNLNSHKRTHEKGKRTAQWHVAKVVGNSVSPTEAAFPHHVQVPPHVAVTTVAAYKADSINNTENSTQQLLTSISPKTQNEPVQVGQKRKRPPFAAQPSRSLGSMSPDSEDGEDE